MKDFKSVAKQVIAQFIDPTNVNPFGWPPSCSAILYEPERPNIEQEDKTGEECKLK